jgi:hypothetical protein
VELRNRRPPDTPAAEPVRAPDRREPPDGPERPPGRRLADGRPVRPEAPGYDANAEFKKGVPRPPRYSPDDTGEPAGHDRAGRGPAAAIRGREWHHDERATAEMPARREVQERDSLDTPRAVVDHPDFRDPRDRFSPDRYGDPLTRPDGTRVPLFDGPARRQQTRQGWVGDCGLIAALGAVARHRPGDISDRVRERFDGSYQVRLSEARQTSTGASPTGRDVELTVTPELPVSARRPDSPAGAKAQDGASWAPVMEKAFAGVDRAWTGERRDAWRGEWAHMCQEDLRDGVTNPHTGPAPEGYVRLNQGSTAWDRAEMLTQLTGQEAEVREFPAGREEWKINQLIREQLTDGKPVLVTSRPARKGEILPHNLKPSHVYEATGVEKGKIILRNPWNHKHPEPMETEEFARNMSRYYSTLA